MSKNLRCLLYLLNCFKVLFYSESIFNFDNISIIKLILFNVVNSCVFHIIFFTIKWGGGRGIYK